jgi:hypothetical protein
MFEKRKRARIEQLKLLYPNENVQIELKKRNKVVKKKIAVIISIGFLFLLIYQIRTMGNNESLTQIFRGAHQTNGEEVELLVEMEGVNPYEITIGIESLEYTEEEIENLYQKLSATLINQILAENKELSYIINDMNLMEEVEGYPFKIYWTSSNYKLISPTGELISENIEKNLEKNGNIVTLTAKISYLEFEREQYYIIDLYEVEKTSEEKMRNKINNLLSEEEKNSRQSEAVELPIIVDGKSIKWVKKEKSYNFNILAFFISLVIFVVLEQNLKEKREVKNREKEMNLRYPELISKLTLLLCAGYTLQKSWVQMVEDYEKREVKIYAYEQMLQVSRKMERGLPEGLAYEEFGNLCKQDQYRKLGILLSQNLKRGNKNVVERMKEEARRAYKTRRENAKEAGAKAETKLLLPMMLLLMLVLLVIVIPVFVSM